MWHVQPSILSSLTLPPELRPKEAIDTFITLFRDQLDILHRGHQLIVRRRDALCAELQDTRYCSPIGTHVYDWKNKRLLEPSTKREAKLSAADTEAIERLLFSIELGQARPTRAAIRASGLSKKLAARIGLSRK